MLQQLMDFTFAPNTDGDHTGMQGHYNLNESGVQQSTLNANIYHELREKSKLWIHYVKVNKK